MDLEIIDSIRLRFQTHQLTVCRDVSAAIEAELGYPQVKGLFNGVHPHCWNVNGNIIIDATANQFGMDPINISTVKDKRYVPFTEKHLAFIAEFAEDNYGKFPDMEDFLFMDMDDEENDEE